MSDQEKNTESSKPQRKKRKKISHRYLYNSGLYYLERFPASVAHFKMVMTRKIDRSFQDHPDQNREQALQWLNEVADRFQELGYLNDVQFAAGIIRSFRRKGFPSMKIMQKSREKGLERSLAMETLKKIDQELKQEAYFLDDQQDPDAYNPDYEAALTYCRRKRMSSESYKSDKLDQEEAYKLKNKYLGRLARQGFSFDIANRALDNS